MNFPRHRTGFIVTDDKGYYHRERGYCHRERGYSHREQANCHRGQGVLPQRKGRTATEDKVYFCLSPCAGCKTRQGGCCSRLKIPELARGIFKRLQQPWLVRDIASSTRGLFLFLSFPRETTETANTGVPGEQFPWVLKSFSRQQHFANQVLGRKS